jgi:hypothetical protein
MEKGGPGKVSSLGIEVYAAACRACGFMRFSVPEHERRDAPDTG